MMQKKITDPFIINGLKILLGIILALKFTISFNTGLFEDEAIYWNWSQNPDPSYSFTTLIGIKIFTMMPGLLNEFTVRMAALLTNFVIILFFYKTGKMLGFSKKKILISMILLFSIPFVTIYTSFISPDSMLLMFSVISIYFTLRVLKFGSLKDWILCGITFGLLILSKYTGAVFVPAFAVFLFLKRNEINSITYEKITAVVISLLVIISPLIIWNIIYEPVWINYYVNTGADAVSSGLGENLWKFILSQIAILLPISFLFIIYITVKQFGKKDKSVEEKYLLFSGIFIFSVFAVLAMAGKLKGNWAFTAYIPLVISFLFVNFTKFKKSSKFIITIFTLMIGMNLFLLILLNLNSDSIKNIADNKFGNYINDTFHDYWPGHKDLTGNDKNWEDRILKMKHWQKNITEISSEINSNDLEYDFIASDNFNLSPLLKFYMKKENVYLVGDMRFRYLNSAEVFENLSGKDAVIVTYKGSDIKYLYNKFEEVKEVKDIKFSISKDLIQEFRILQCRNFKPELVSVHE
ncbi:MAG: glycosyltransferase family 39 protein [Ignavibacteria bacterium]